MADDGMLMNFELGDAPLLNQVKFKGGRWRDRVKAQKSVKKWDDAPLKKDSSTAAAPSAGRPKTARFIPGVGVQVQGGDDDDADRPAKRPRTDGDAQPQPQPRPQQPRPQIKSGQTSSKLFTSNPTPITKFDEKPAEEETDEAKPSNAPLSGEAENFVALGLSRRIAQHLSTKMEMKAPTAIQKHTIPQLVKEDNDAFLQAETGSGKTLAYLLPIVQRITALSQNEDGSSTGVQLHRDSGLFAIVLAPTRELCKQIAAVLERLLRCAPWIVSTTVTGGESKKSEKARLRKGVNILIATPGRLTDHLDNTKVLDVGTVRWLVLDEGDRMMEMGFEDDLKTIVGEIRKDPLKNETKDGVVLDKVLPSRRVTVLCSATMKMNVQKLGEISLTDAVHITATATDEEKDADGNTIESTFAAPSQLKQSYLIVPAKLRLVTLIALLKSTFARKGSVMKAIIFISCADSVNFHFDLLKSTTPPSKPKPTLPPS
ncbi:DEAD-domain-containing protein, partial [Coniochaeta hoffmannii]